MLPAGKLGEVGEIWKINTGMVFKLGKFLKQIPATGRSKLSYSKKHFQ